MLKKSIILLALSLFAACFTALAQEQEPKKPDPAEMAEKETERLGQTLELEDWQLFYLDSLLNYNYTELIREFDALQRAHASNADMYAAVQDKWMERTEEAYRKLFTGAQWEAYLKQGGARIIKDREKRRERALKALEKVKK